MLKLLMLTSKPHDAVLGVVPGKDGFTNIAEDPAAQSIPGVVVYRFDSPLLFSMPITSRIESGKLFVRIRNERTNLDLLGGLAMNREYFKGFDNDRTSAEAQLGQTLSHQFNSRVSLKEQLFVFPNLSRGGEYRINFDTTLVTEVTRRIGWQLTLSDRYLSDPPGGFKQNDLILTTGIRVKLGTLK